MPKSRSTKQEVSDRAKALKILQTNQNLNFVQRILRPQDYPVLRDKETGPEGFATHAMAFEHLGPPGKESPAVFPTVVWDPQQKALRRLPIEQAKQHAFQSGEFIAFPSSEEADWFAKGGYKLGSFQLPSAKDFQ